MLYSYSLNGIHQAPLSVEERALHYGDGLFETIAFVNQSPVLWNAHMDRLARGCRVLGIPCPSGQQLLSEASILLPEEAFSLLKIVLSRGIDGRGYRPSEQIAMNRYLLAYKIDPLWRSNPIETRVCSMPWSVNSRLAGLKTLNRLDQVLAQAECKTFQIDEGVMTDGNGHLISGTKSNLFLIEANTLVTPKLNQAGIAGTLRDFLLQEASCFGYKSEVCDISIERMKTADAAFFTNSVMGLLPIKSFEEVAYVESSKLKALQKQVHLRLRIPCL